MTDHQRPLISVVVPLYNAEGCVAPLCQRLTGALHALTAAYEILLIDDRSVDGSWTKAREIAATDGRIKLVRLSRNFGQHHAITAGLSLARGTWVVVMDCDLQDAPEDIPALYAKALEGHDVVYAYQQKVYMSFPRKVFAGLYHLLILSFNRHDKEQLSGAFSLLSRKAVDAFLKVQDSQRHYLIILRWIGFKQIGIPLPRHPRLAGRSSYSLAKLFSLAVDGVIIQSTELLRWTVKFGLLIALGAGLFMARVIILKLLHPAIAFGWSSLMATLLFSTGILLANIGVLGIYLERVFIQTKNRPLFLIDEEVNLDR